MDSKPNNSEPEYWHSREAGYDPVLEELLCNKENFMNELTSEERANKAVQKRIEEMNETIGSRQERVGIDPITGPDMLYTPETE